jgi:hypothetical protein
MSATSQQYYNFLMRIDHPVFFKDFSTEQNADSPFNSILTRIFANRLVEATAALQSFIQNSFANTVNADGIDDWENEYFGYTKPSLDLETRVEQLLIKVNNQIRMNAPSVITVSQAITGQTPTLIRNLWKSGWVLGQSVLSFSTVLSTTQDADAGLYIVIFANPITSAQRIALDNALTQIQKGGSRHSIVAPPQKWVLGTSALSIDTVLS